MKTPQAPSYPAPAQTAETQAGYNRDTAQTQALMNMINQVGPEGSLTYSRTGNNTFTDAQGRTVTVPQYTATKTYSPEGQELYNIGQQTEKNIATIGRDQSSRIGDLLGTPLRLGNEATEGRLMELGMSRLQPQFNRNEESLRTRLANSGIRQGTSAWDTEMGRLGQNQNDAINQLLLSGRAQANQELMSERNQPINEITALMSGSQVNQPNFVSTPQTQVGGVDYAGQVAKQYEAQQNAYNQKMAQNNAMIGGLFGLGSSATRFLSPLKW